ncbi:MAG: hypothetical protein H0V50_06060 [Thermoleophilaceae bacterium]|nr:hypothetical protein [Thermoleophilaceae bacterium]
MTTDPSPQLDYAPALPMLRRARMRRWITAGSALLLLAGIITLAPRAARRLQFAYWQRQCMSYAAPPTQVVHDNDPVEIPKLIAPPLSYDGSLAIGRAFLIPAAYRRLLVNSSVGTAFLHERVTPQGEARLVAVDLYTTSLRTNTMGFLANALDPSTTVRGPRALLTVTRGDGANVAVQPGDVFRVFAGQPDPKDASHFTIDYLLNGTRYTLDGWLKDGGVVIIEARD